MEFYSIHDGKETVMTRPTEFQYKPTSDEGFWKNNLRGKGNYVESPQRIEVNGVILPAIRTFQAELVPGRVVEDRQGIVRFLLAKRNYLGILDTLARSVRNYLVINGKTSKLEIIKQHRISLGDLNLVVNRAIDLGYNIELHPDQTLEFINN